MPVACWIGPPNAKHIDAAMAKKNARSVGLYYEDEIIGISIKLLDGIRGMIDDTLMRRSRNCRDGHGLEV